MATTPALKPVGTTSAAEVQETEKISPTFQRQLVHSVPGRIVMSSYETLRATGTGVACLSPWGDSSPLIMPCILFRDVAKHTVHMLTGGITGVIDGLIGPAAEIVSEFFEDDIGLVTDGINLATKAAKGRASDRKVKKPAPIHSKRLETTDVKIIRISFKYLHTMSDAALSFHRSSESNSSVFGHIKNYVAVHKGWFSPYLFATARRPTILRHIKPDIICCHGPFLSGDYTIGKTLLQGSAMTIALCNVPSLEVLPPVEQENRSWFRIPFTSKSPRNPTPDPAPAPIQAPPAPPRMVILLVGLKPYRKVWAQSARPGESLINYILLNSCPAIVVPVKVSAPLVAWHAVTLKQLWKIDLPREDPHSTPGKFEGVVDSIFAFVDQWLDWDRVNIPVAKSNVASQPGLKDAHNSVGDAVPFEGRPKDAITLLVAAAIRAKSCKSAKKKLNAGRSGIAMWRIS